MWWAINASDTDSFQPTSASTKSARDEDLLTRLQEETAMSSYYKDQWASAKQTIKTLEQDKMRLEAELKVVKEMFQNQQWQMLDEMFTIGKTMNSASVASLHS